MRRTGKFICNAEQRPDPDATFRAILRDGPWHRDNGCNRWHLFRRVFDLDANVTGASLDITADGRYQLFVNGTRIGRGPARASPDFQRVDRYDVTPHLAPGRNLLAVLVHVYGVDTAWYQRSRDYWQSVLGDGGLYVSCRVTTPDGTIALESDRNWRSKVCDAWRRDTPRSGWGQDFIEDFDAARSPLGWTERDYDDSAWEAATEMILEAGAEDRAKGWGSVEPFPTLLPREIPMLAEAQLEPMAVTAAYRVIPRPDLGIDERIFAEALEPAPADAVVNAEALLHDDGECTRLFTTPERDTSLLIQFERIHSGYPFVEIEGARGREIIEVAVAETVPGEFEEAPEIPVRVARRSDLDCAHVFRYVARPGDQRFEKFEWTAIRYLQLTVRNAPAGLAIRRVGSTYTHYPFEFEGAFECSDVTLTQLWEIGRYTAVQCTHDAREDCPGREKRQWLGDALVQQLIGAAAFGTSARAIDLKYLYDAAQSQRPDGLLQMFAPGDHHVDGIIIPDFNLHWILTLYHYHMHYDDADALGELFPTVQKVLAWFERQLGADALLTNLPHWHFIEWSALERGGVSLSINALMIGALRAAAALARSLGYERAAERYAAGAQSAADALNLNHWDEARGAYVDSVDPADLVTAGEQAPRAAPGQVSQQGNALMIHFDIAPQARWPRIVERITDPTRLKLTAVPPVVMEGQPIDRDHDVVLANTFFSHYVFSALADAGRFDLAMAQMRAFYRPMLEAGATTLWESYHAGASLCHAFSATPVHQLSAHLLGVRPGTPGFGEIVIAPQPGDLEWARGTYPTRHGPVAVSWRREEDVFELEVGVPPGAEAQVSPPPGYRLERQARALEAGKHVVRCHRNGAA